MAGKDQKRKVGGQFAMLPRVARLALKDEDLAQLAADDYARAETYELELCDRHHPEIVLGSMAVVVVWGSTEAVKACQKLLVEGSEVLREESGEI
ncbi:MAG TPA: hypothetical protein VKW06_00325 [Candidatus Angelobacter sp.]|nr:hypothetical protein [Candidatus Angelobacter sp.]